MIFLFGHKAFKYCKELLLTALLVSVLGFNGPSENRDPEKMLAEKYGRVSLHINIISYEIGA
jgi:hypothetical protein